MESKIRKQSKERELKAIKNYSKLELLESFQNLSSNILEIKEAGQKYRNILKLRSKDDTK